MKKLVSALALLSLPLMVAAQGNVSAKEYTHTTDYSFRSAPELNGLVIHPKEGKLSNSPILRTVKLGLVEFKITDTDLYVVENVKYSTTGIISESDFKNYRLTIQQTTQNRANSMYEVVLMDLRNPDVQGYLKVFYNNFDQVQRLQFKPTPTEPERTYELAPPPSDIEQRDGKFFTHTEDLTVEVVTDLWSRKQTIFPFSFVKTKGDHRQIGRIYPSDRTKIAFEERTELKGKKEKLVQYVVISQVGADNQEVKTEYLVKKIRETHTNPKDKTSPKNIEITVTAGLEAQESVLTLVRSNAQHIKAATFQSPTENIEYLFREGKRK